MFTGIVDATGEVLGVETLGVNVRLWIRAPSLTGASLGASVALDGVCLTVADLDARACAFDVSPETIARSTLGAKREGSRVNIERPLSAGAEIGGHIVQGHVDGTGAVESVTDDARGRRVRIRLPEDLERYVVEKGSVAIDGVSLTVSALSGAVVEVALIPHTLAATTLSDLRPGDRVNVEVDVLAKYVERLVTRTIPPTLERSS